MQRLTSSFCFEARAPTSLIKTGPSHLACAEKEKPTSKQINIDFFIEIPLYIPRLVFGWAPFSKLTMEATQECANYNLIATRIYRPKHPLCHLSEEPLTNSIMIGYRRIFPGGINEKIYCRYRSCPFASSNQFC